MNITEIRGLRDSVDSLLAKAKTARDTRALGEFNTALRALEAATAATRDSEERISDVLDAQRDLLDDQREMLKRLLSEIECQCEIADWTKAPAV